MEAEKSFKVSLFTGKTDTRPNEARRTWARMCERFKKPLVRAEKDGPTFSPAVFDPAYRLQENVKELSLLVLDYDHEASFDADLAVWQGMGIRFAAHTTHSHGRVTDCNPDAADRFRVVIPLAAPIPAAQFPALWQWAAQLSGGKVDPQAKDLHRMYYVPAVASLKAPYKHFIADGELLDWRVLGLAHHIRPAAAHQREGEPSGANGFTTREERDAEYKRRLKARGRQNRKGIFEARGECHNGKGNTAHCYNPETGAAWCSAGCDYQTRLRSVGLDDRPLPSVRAEEDVAYGATPATWPELPEKALYGLAGDIVRTIDPHTEADPAAVLVQTLVAFGNCVGRGPYFTAEADRHHLNLFAVLVGATSKGRKGTSWGHARRLYERV